MSEPKHLAFALPVVRLARGYACAALLLAQFMEDCHRKAWIEVAVDGAGDPYPVCLHHAKRLIEQLQSAH